MPVPVGMARALTVAALPVQASLLSQALHLPPHRHRHHCPAPRPPTGQAVRVEGASVPVPVPVGLHPAPQRGAVTPLPTAKAAHRHPLPVARAPLALPLQASPRPPPPCPPPPPPTVSALPTPWPPCALQGATGEASLMRHWQPWTHHHPLALALALRAAVLAHHLASALTQQQGAAVPAVLRMAGILPSSSSSPHPSPSSTEGSTGSNTAQAQRCAYTARGPIRSQGQSKRWPTPPGARLRLPPPLRLPLLPAPMRMGRGLSGSRVSTNTRPHTGGSTQSLAGHWA